MIRWIRAFAIARRDFRTLPRSIKWITLVLSVYSLIWGLWDPFFPIYLKQILGNYTQTALVTAFFYIFLTAWSVPIGRLADVFSKKKLVGFFLFLYLPLGPMIVFLRTVAQLTAFRFYHAFLATGLWATAETYVRAHSPEHQQAEAMGILDTGLNGAIVIGAVASGFIVAAFGILPLFYAAPAIIGIALALTIFYLPDHSGTSDWSRALPELGFRAFKKSARDFLRRKPLVFLGILSSCFGFATAGVSAILLPLFSEVLGASPVQIGIIFALSLAPFVFEAPFAVIADHFSNRKIILWSGAVSAVILLMLYFTRDLRWLSIAAFLLGLAFAMMTPILGGRATAFMPKAHIGELNGVYRALGSLSGGIGILIVGPLADSFGIQVPFLFASVFMALFVLIAFFGWRAMEE